MFAELDLDYLENVDLAYHIVDSVGRLAEKVTENRVKYLSRRIDELMRENNLSDVVYRIENRGYLSKSRHYTVDAETERDYPELVLIVERAGEVFELEVNPYDEVEPVSLELL